MTHPHPPRGLQPDCAAVFDAGITILVNDVVLATGAILASALLHKGLLYNCLRSPLTFFDTTPTGRIINRFSKDVDSIDVVIPKTMSFFIMILMAVLGTLFVICYSTPIFLAVSLPLSAIYYFVQVLQSQLALLCVAVTGSNM